MDSSCCVSCDSRLLVTPPRSFLGMRARAEPFFPEPFLLDKRRVGFMRRANFLGDRRFLDLVGILLLKYLIFFLMYHDRMVFITNLPSKSVSTHGTTLGVTGIFEKLEFPPILIGNEKKKTLVAKKHLYFYKVGKHVASQITCQCSKLLLD